ncbi:MAG: hypothetical protein JNL04_00485 [Rhodospirillaceae bacterium]|nr:hypothetical protein [Rhodospirillaceae bacterium]
MQDLLAALIAFILIDPLRAGLSRTLEAAGLPPAAVVEVVACTGRAAPAIVDRVLGNPVDAAWRVAGFWTGAVGPKDLLSEFAPECATTLDAVGGRPAAGLATWMI